MKILQYINSVSRMYPFHSQCRGIQTKRFVIEPGYKSVHDSGNTDLKSTSYNGEYNGIPNSRLWTTLLDNVSGLFL